MNASTSLDPYILFLYAYASILLGHIERSIPVIDRLKRHSSFIAGRELSAFIRLKSASSREDALVGYIDMTGENSVPGHIRKIIARIRKTADFGYFQRTVSIQDCIPLRAYSPERILDREDKQTMVRRRVRVRKMPQKIILASLILILCVLGYFAFTHLDVLRDLVREKESQMDIIDKVDISNEKYPVIDKHPSQDMKYLYEDEAVLKSDFASARALIRDGKCNDALVILNKIMLSNAQLKVRDNASFLFSYVNGLEERDSSDIPYHEIMSKPDLYRGVMLTWSCSVISVEKRKGGTALTVAVADKFVKVPSYAEVFYPGDASLVKQSTLTVTGVYSQMIGKENRPYIEARKIDVVQ
jgi:hypothetical protein